MAYSPVPCHLRTFKPTRCDTKRRFRLFCLCSYHRLCKCMSCILQESPNVWPRHQRSDLITLESTLPNSQWTNGRHDLKILFNGAWRRVSSLSLSPLDPSLYPVIQICKRESQSPSPQYWFQRQPSIPNFPSILLVPSSACPPNQTCSGLHWSKRPYVFPPPSSDLFTFCWLNPVHSIWN